MRSFAAGLAIFLSFLTGTTALAAYVTHKVLLDPSQAGRIVDAALADPSVRSRVLSEAVPGYGRLPQGVRADVDRLAQTSTARRVVKRVSLRPNGTVVLAPLRAELARALRDNGRPQLASQLTVAGVSGTVTVPARYMTRYTSARDHSRQVFIRGALLTGILLLAALLVSENRRRTVRSIGITTLLSCAVVTLLFWLLPTVVRAASSDPLVEAVVGVLREERSAVLLTMLPLAVVALLLVVGSLAGARPPARG